jgi:hypothetical protein
MARSPIERSAAAEILSAGAVARVAPGGAFPLPRFYALQTPPSIAAFRRAGLCANPEGGLTLLFGECVGTFPGIRVAGEVDGQRSS